jgi:hypothetical protein
MTRKAERVDKAVEPEELNTASPMERFKLLARRLLHVSPDELDDEREKFKRRKPS